jgi:hypothetical protein
MALQFNVPPMAIDILGDRWTIEAHALSGGRFRHNHDFGRFVYLGTYEGDEDLLNYGVFRKETMPLEEPNMFKSAGIERYSFASMACI